MTIYTQTSNAKARENKTHAKNHNELTKLSGKSWKSSWRKQKKREKKRITNHFPVHTQF